MNDTANLVGTRRRPPPPVPPRLPRKHVAQVQAQYHAETIAVATNGHTQKPADDVAVLSPLLSSVSILSTTTEIAGPGVNLITQETSVLQTSCSPRQSQVAAPDASQEIFIGVVGITGSGKSSFIKRVTGCSEDIIAHSLKSGTKHVNHQSIQLGDIKVNLVDTPGFNDTQLEDEDVLQLLLDWLKNFHLNGSRFSGLLYLYPINKTREKGSDRRSLKVFQRLVGSQNFGHVVIGITFHDQEDPSVVDARERTLRESKDFWADMVAAGTTVTRISSDERSCRELVARMAGRRQAITLQAEQEIFDEHRPVAEISAMAEMQDHNELKLLRLREDMERMAQQMVFDERVRLTLQFSEERAELEQKLFEQRQAALLVEEELIIWKNTCEKDKEDAKAMQLQHARAEELHKQEREQKERESELEAEKARSEKAQTESKKKEDLRYAKAQYQKDKAICSAKGDVLKKYSKIAKDNGVDIFELVPTSYPRFSVFIGRRCVMCWSVLDWNLPFLRKCTWSLCISSDTEIPDSLHQAMLAGTINGRLTEYRTPQKRHGSSSMH